MLYHKDLGIPKRVRGCVPTGLKSVTYSSHAQREFADKYGRITPPEMVNFGECELIEVTIYGQAVDKLVLRKPHNERYDLVLVVIPHESDKKRWFAKTVWLNAATDTHATLDKSRFAK